MNDIFDDYYHSDFVIGILRDFDVEKIVFTLDGGGDSGIVEISEVVRRPNSNQEIQLDEIPAPEPGRTLSQYMTDIVANWPELDWVNDELDWVNDEGGYGDITIFPFNETDEQVYISVTQRNEDYNEGDFDDEDGFNWVDDADNAQVGARHGNPTIEVIEGFEIDISLGRLKNDGVADDTQADDTQPNAPKP